MYTPEKKSGILKIILITGLMLSSFKPQNVSENTFATARLSIETLRLTLRIDGFRFWDLLRWGIASDVLNGDFYGASFPKAKNLRKKGTKADPFSRWYVTSKAFRKGIDDKWPIPQREQNINPNLR